MKAAVYVGDPDSLAFEELKPNSPGPRDVVVEIGASGVCHSDLSIMRGYVRVPSGMVLGHEGAGRVVEVGPDVTRIGLHCCSGAATSQKVHSNPPAGMTAARRPCWVSGMIASRYTFAEAKGLNLIPADRSTMSLRCTMPFTPVGLGL